MKELENEDKKNLSENIDSKTTYDDSGKFEEFQSISSNEEVIKDVAKGEKSAEELTREMTETEVLNIAMNNPLFKVMLFPCAAANVKLSSRLIEMTKGPYKEADFEKVVNENLNKLQHLISKEPNGLVFVNGKLDVGASIKQAADNNLGLNTMFADTREAEYFKSVYNSALESNNIFAGRFDNDLSDKFWDTFSFSYETVRDFKTVYDSREINRRFDNYIKEQKKSLGKDNSQVALEESSFEYSIIGIQAIFESLGIIDTEFISESATQMRNLHSIDDKGLVERRRTEIQKAKEGNSTLVNNMSERMLKTSLDTLERLTKIKEGFFKKANGEEVGEGEKKCKLAARQLVALKLVLSNYRMFDNTNLKLNSLNEGLYKSFKEQSIALLKDIDPSFVNEQEEFDVKKIIEYYNSSIKELGEKTKELGLDYNYGLHSIPEGEEGLDELVGQRLRKQYHVQEARINCLRPEEYYDKNSLINHYLFEGSGRRQVMKTMALDRVMEEDYGVSEKFASKFSGIETYSPEERASIEGEFDNAKDVFLRVARMQVERKINSETLERVKKAESYDNINDLPELDKKRLFEYAIVTHKPLEADSEHGPRYSRELYSRMIEVVQKIYPDVVVNGKIDETAMMKHYNEEFLRDDEKPIESVDDMKKRATRSVFSEMKRSIIRDGKDVIREAGKRRAEELGMTYEEFREARKNNSFPWQQQEKENQPQIPNDNPRSISNEEAEPVVEERAETLVVGESSTLGEKASEEEKAPKQTSITEPEAKPAIDKKAENVVVNEPKEDSKDKKEEIPADNKNKLDDDKHKDENNKVIVDVEPEKPEETSMIVKKNNVFSRFLNGFRERLDKLKNIFNRNDKESESKYDEGSEAINNNPQESNENKKNDQDVFRVLQGDELEAYNKNVQNIERKNKDNPKAVKGQDIDQEHDIED